MYEKTIKLDYSSGLWYRPMVYSDARGFNTSILAFIRHLCGYYRRLYYSAITDWWRIHLVITIAALTGTLKIGEAISGFANSAIWLIVGAFLFSRGFIKTGLGKRIAYNLIAAFGSSSLRLAYALALSDLIWLQQLHLIQLV